MREDERHELVVLPTTGFEVKYFTMEKILCPIDFSDVSLNALEFAVAIGEKEKAAITLLNIFTPRDFDKVLEAKDIKEEYDKLLELAETKLKAISKEVMKMSKRKGLMDCRYKLESGKIVDVLARITEEEKYDLIVVGTTGFSAYDKKYLGGNAEQIIHHTCCPVMAVPQFATFEGINRIVYATDYQEEDKIALQHLQLLAAHLHASIEVLHISHHDDTIDKAIFEDYKDELMKFVHYGKVTFNREVFAHVADGLDEYMKRSKSDLLVLLEKRRNFLDSIFHKSLTENLDKFTDYPLLVYKL